MPHSSSGSSEVSSGDDIDDIDDGLHGVRTRLWDPARTPTPTPCAEPASGPAYSSPVKGTRAERKAQRLRKGVKKQKLTKSKIHAEKEALQEREREQTLEEILQLMKSKSVRFGELLAYIFNPESNKGMIHWHEFFVYKGSATQILDWWTSKKYSKVARQEVSNWAVMHVEHLVAKEARKVTQSKILQTLGKPIDEDLVMSFSFASLHDELEEDLAPVSIRIIKALATSRHAQSKHSVHRRERTKMVRTLLVLLSSHLIYYYLLGGDIGCSGLPWGI